MILHTKTWKINNIYETLSVSIKHLKKKITSKVYFIVSNRKKRNCFRTKSHTRTYLHLNASNGNEFLIFCTNKYTKYYKSSQKKCTIASGTYVNIRSKRALERLILESCPLKIIAFSYWSTLVNKGL